MQYAFAYDIYIRQTNASTLSQQMLILRKYMNQKKGYTLLKQNDFLKIAGTVFSNVQRYKENEAIQIGYKNVLHFYINLYTFKFESAIHILFFIVYLRIV